MPKKVDRQERRTLIADALVRVAAEQGLEAVSLRHVAAARSRLRRLDPHETFVAVERGAILIDIRPAAQRAEHGEIPGAVIIERNVLEWRLDPRSDARISFATRYDLEVIITCQEGYTSSLAAASLHDLGLTRATDLIGGFAAWQAAGLPTV